LSIPVSTKGDRSFGRNSRYQPGRLPGKQEWLPAGNAGGEGAKLCINLFDLKGRMVYSFSDIKQSGTYFIKTHNISNGLYLLNLIIDDKKFDEKIMIK